MWNEIATDVEVLAPNTTSTSGFTKPAVIESVEPGSIGDELGLEPGDKLISINGIKPRDIIDYKFLIVEEELSIQIKDSAGKIHNVEFEKEPDDG